MQNCSNELTVKYSVEIKSLTVVRCNIKNDRLTETSYVQNANIITGRFERNALIDIRYDVIKQSAIQCLC